MTTASPSPPRDSALIQRLRESIRRIEGGGGAGLDDGGPAAVALGDGAVDGHLPWGGLRRAGLHALNGGDGTVTGFAAGLLSRFAGAAGTVIWCRRDGDLYGPGLAGFGLGPERLIVVRARRAADCLWAMEESLRSGTPAAVLGEVEKVETTAARRLQLAAEAGGVAALLLTGDGGTPLPALTRWRVSAAAAEAEAEDAVAGDAAPPPLARPRWLVELRHCRGGRPAAWIMEWRDGATGGFAVAAELRHRPAAPAGQGDGGDVRPFRRAG